MKKLGLFFLCSLAACQQPTTYGPQVTPEEIATERAVQGGMAADAEINRQQRHNEERLSLEKRLLRVAGPVAKAGARLCMEINPPGTDCVFRIVLEPELDENGRKRRSNINAYADGENVVITPAMMRFVRSDEELALVLAHEYAHNAMGHVSSKQVNAIAGALLGAAVDALAASQGYGGNGDFMRAGAQIGAGSYSVAFEQEADYVGLYIAARSGYNVKKAIHFWRRFSVREPELIDVSTTHPTNPERFIALQKVIYEIDYKRKHHIPLVPDLKQTVTSSL